MTVDIICPLYKAEQYVEKLQESLEKQENVEIKNIRYIITEANDNTENEVKKLQDERILYKVIHVDEFSHSLTREKEAYESNADIICFITQDVKINSRDWLKKLIEPIETGEASATYSRQTCNDKKSIEYYTRKKNYPEVSELKSNDDIKRLGLNTFFYSDAASAIDRKVFLKLKGYDQKDLPTNEDMYIAYKLITNGYKIKYCANSIVEHSHNFSFRETYKRYKSYGKFMKSEPYLNQYKTTKAGSGLAKYIIKSAIKDGNIRIIIKFLPDMIARFVGLKIGRIS